MPNTQLCHCGSGKEKDLFYDGKGIFLFSACSDCYEAKRASYRVDIFEDYETEEQVEEDDGGYAAEEDDYDRDIEFSRPGENSALRAASKSNPRNISCPTCHKPNTLTPKDAALGYQCDSCADKAESGWG